MTLQELLEKGEGKAWVVGHGSKASLKEIDCLAITYEVAKQRNYFCFGWHYYADNGSYMLARKSKVRRNDFPSVVNINGGISYIRFERRDFAKERIERDGYIIFLNKEEACDFAIEKIKKQKLELNKLILKINKLKFGI